jgi:hypothetical protein
MTATAITASAPAPAPAAATAAGAAGDACLTGWGYHLLDDLMAAVGVDGLFAAAADPWLRATVDGHAAAARRRLAQLGHGVTIASLAGYANALLTVVHSCGRRLPADAAGLDWAAAEWFELHLLGVCALALDVEDLDIEG